GTVVRKEAAAPARPGRDLVSALSPDDVIYHLSRAFYHIRHDAQEERQRRGWTDPEYSTLVALGREDGKTVDEINAASIYRGRSVTPDVVRSLAARGLVSVEEPVRGESVVHMTAAGKRAIIEIIAILKAGEADALEGFDFSEIQLLKQLLGRIVDKS